MKINRTALIAPYGDDKITNDILSKTIRPFIYKQCEPGSIFQATGGSPGAAIAVQSPVSVEISPENHLKAISALNFIFELTTLDELTPTMLLCLMNIQLTQIINSEVESVNDNIIVSPDGICISEYVDEESGVLMPTRPISFQHIFELKRSYLVYIGLISESIPTLTSTTPPKYTAVEYSDEQSDVILDRGVEEFYNLMRIFKQQSIQLIK